MRLLSATLIAMSIALSSNVGQCDILFSVDAATDELVTINASTGDVNIVGSLGIDAIQIDLAYLNGTLYAVNSDFGVNVDLFEIDTHSGTANFIAPLTAGSSPVLNAEGLAAEQGGLVVGFSTTPGDFTSSRLGRLSLDGTITSDGETGVDMDALGNTRSGTLWAVDAVVSTNTNIVYTLEPTTLVGTHSPVDDGPYDVAFVGDTMYGITPTGLSMIDTSNGSLIGIIALSRPGDVYRGLAAIPEPSSFCLLSIFGLCGILRRSSRRREAQHLHGL